MNTFILVETNPVISMDVLGMIDEAFPDHKLIQGENLGAVTPDVKAAGPEVTLIISAGMSSTEDAAMLRDAVARGSQLIWLGEPEVDDIPAIVITLPFTNDTVLAAFGDAGIGGHSVDHPQS